MSDDDLIEFAREFREGILNGEPSAMMCAAVSWPMATLLRCYGVECRCAETREIAVPLGTINHVWIELADGRALDATADQFPGYPPVYLGERREIHA